MTSILSCHWRSCPGRAPRNVIWCTGRATLSVCLSVCLSVSSICVGHSLSPTALRKRLIVLFDSRSTTSNFCILQIPYLSSRQTRPPLLGSPVKDSVTSVTVDTMDCNTKTIQLLCLVQGACPPSLSLSRHICLHATSEQVTLSTRSSGTLSADVSILTAGTLSARQSIHLWASTKVCSQVRSMLGSCPKSLWVSVLSARPSQISTLPILSGY